jgi:hypothetical protein
MSRADYSFDPRRYVPTLAVLNVLPELRNVERQIVEIQTVHFKHH